jgi:hypothetical protein
MTTVAQLAHATAAGILVIASASAETLITDLPLADIGSQRVLYAAPAHPRAILLMSRRRW